MENNNELSEMIEYINSLYSMSSDEKRKEFLAYKDVIKDLNKHSNIEYIKYTLLSLSLGVLNRVKSNQYSEILNTMKKFRNEITYEKSCLVYIKHILKTLLKLKNYEDIVVLYSLLVEITSLHNNRASYSNSLFDIYFNALRGINLNLPLNKDYDNPELKKEIMNSVNYLVKKIN